VDVSDINSNTKIGQLAIEGRKHTKVLHEYNSVIPKLYQVKGEAQNKAVLYAKNFKVLEPQVNKMRKVFDFYNTIVSTLLEFFQKYVNEQIPKGDMADIINLLDAGLLVDSLKTWQAGLNNDFSMYRRSISYVKKDYNMSDDEPLRNFLVTPGNIIKDFRKQLQSKCPEFYKVLVPIIASGIAEFEKNSKDFKYLRVITLCVFLVDEDLSNGKVMSYLKKNIKIKKTQKIFDDNPRIKLYGELPFNVQNYIKASTNFNNAQDGGSGCTIL